MYNFDVSDHLQRILTKLSKKDKDVYGQILKKIDEVININYCRGQAICPKDRARAF